ncbi:hypothetical protein, partial [Klebsiella pneumoniae]|uniref:hypothetical protein n=1 Tax=Klebsiella pneumoniae TaxID=573 RepID=UPI0025A285D5
YLIIPLALWCWLSNDRVYRKPLNYVVITFFVVLLTGIIFFNLVPKELNKWLPVIAGGLFSILFLQYLWLVFKNTKYRLAWRSNGLLLF